MPVFSVFGVFSVFASRVWSLDCDVWVTLLLYSTGHSSQYFTALDIRGPSSETLRKNAKSPNYTAPLPVSSALPTPLLPYEHALLRRAALTNVRALTHPS